MKKRSENQIFLVSIDYFYEFFMKWYLKVMKQYADFGGRARRKEFWMFLLFNVIFLYLAMIIDSVLGITVGEDFSYGWFFLFYCLSTFLPGLAVQVRRLHDVGKSGWNLFLALIPLVGIIIQIIWFLTDSHAGENKWGSNPKEQLEQKEHG